MTLLIPYQCPMAFDDPFLSIFGGMAHFAAPLAIGEEPLLGTLKTRRGCLGEQFPNVAPRHFSSSPAVDTLGAFIPEDDTAVQIVDHNRIPPAIEHRRLL